MTTVGGQLPIGSDEPTECAADVRGVKTICSDVRDISNMKKFLISTGATNTSLKTATDDEIVIRTLEKLGLTSESEIYTNDEYRKFVGSSTADNVLKTKFKPIGPGNSTALLDNFNIDQTLQQWSIASKTEFGKKFYHIPFQMIDFMKMNTELSKLDIVDLMKNGYDCFGVILNTDVSSGRGKHWFAIFGDLKHDGSKSDPIKVEYFNSSGNPPRPEIMIWLEQTQHNLMRDSDISMDIVYATTRQVQYSQTECGVWSLVYILSRLMNHPPNWIVSVGANDNDMIQYRAQLFRTAQNS